MLATNMTVAMNESHVRIKERIAKSKQDKLEILGSKGMSTKSSKLYTPNARAKYSGVNSPHFGHVISKSSLVSKNSQKESDQRGDSLIKLKRELLFGVNFPLIEGHENDGRNNIVSRRSLNSNMHGNSLKSLADQVDQVNGHSLDIVGSDS